MIPHASRTVVGLFLLFIVCAGQASARSVRSREIGVREWRDLIRTAGVIAQVRITAAEGGERYEPVYRAVVEEAFKGVQTGAVLHLGGSSFETGAVYLVFLRQEGTVDSRLREGEFSRSFPSGAPYYDIERELFGQFRLLVTEAFGDVDVAAAFAREWVTLPDGLRRVARNCNEEEPEALVLRDELYASIRETVLATPACDRASFSIGHSHMTNPIRAPFIVRELRGRFVFSGEQIGVPGELLRFQVNGPGGRVIHVPVAEDGTFFVTNLPPGRYCFRTASEELQGYEGTIVIDPDAGRAEIVIAVAIGA